MTDRFSQQRDLEVSWKKTTEKLIISGPAQWNSTKTSSVEQEVTSDLLVVHCDILDMNPDFLQLG